MCKVKTGEKRGKDLTWQTRELMIKEYLSTGKSKQSIWEKYTGQKKEHGQLLRWLQILGYEDTPKKSKVSPLSMMSEKKKKSPNILKTANSF